MSAPKTKKCSKCGEGFRGTLAPEEVHCAKCFVKTCEVPEDTDEQFLKLLKEAYGSELTTTNPPTTSLAAIISMMDDILNHKKRLKHLETNAEGKESLKRKEKIRIKREILRMREEQIEMDAMKESIRAKMMHFALMSPARQDQSKSSSPSSNSIDEDKFSTPKSVASSPPTPNFSTAVQSPITPTSPNIPLQTVAENKENEENNHDNPAMAKQSPVKLAAAKFEETAKKVGTMVTFKLPSKSKSPKSSERIEQSTEKIKEVNNNDAPITASSEEDENDSRPKALTRSNSVRDRIKAFEAIQRRASTGSFDRKKTQVGEGRRSLSSMKVLNM